MNKNGYTLVELIVGTLLLSILIIYMTSLLVDIKEKEITSGIDSKALVVEATVTKIINSEINKLGLINFAKISNNNNEEIIKLNFKNGTSKYIKIINKNHIIYGNENKIDLEKDLPNNYLVEEAFVENSIYGLNKMVIKIKNKENDKLDFNIEAYSYDKN